MYFALYTISTNLIVEIDNKPLQIQSSYSYPGFEFCLKKQDGSYFQLKKFSYNTSETMILTNLLEIDGYTISGQFETPILINDFILVISKNEIDSNIIFLNLDPAIQFKSHFKMTGIEKCCSISSDSYYKIINSISRTQRIIDFLELMNSIDKNRELTSITNRTIQNTKLYPEAFKSNKAPHSQGLTTLKIATTLDCASKYARQHHTAVLNFANPIEPGGGILRGSSAQEENICRVSNLYKSLSSITVRSYYQKNKEIFDQNQFKTIFIGSDEVIYSPGIQVFKENVNPNLTAYTSNLPFTIDVLTSAAPIFNNSNFVIPNGDLQHIFERRIRNIFEVAIENNVEILILGAFGCGAFHNPPEIVAKAFKTLLTESRYKTAFKKVIFAIIDSKNSNNVDAFYKVLAK